MSIQRTSIGEIVKGRLAELRHQEAELVLELALEILDRNANAHRVLGEYREQKALCSTSIDLLKAFKAYRSRWPE